MKDGRDRLVARRQQLLDRLPPLADIVRGSFFVRHRRCGNSRCRCARGPGHRTAYITVGFKDGSTEQIALTREIEPVARAWVRNYARWWDAVERISGLNRELLRRRRVGPTE
jgi:hypothetical protein